MSKKDVEKTILRKKQTRIMVFGTFDGLHEGHLNFFKQAKKFTRNSFLIVSIARDKNVLKIKGQKPEYKEKKRFAFVKKISFVDKVVLSGENDYLPHILKEKPDIIALGYDQKAYVKELKKDIKKISIKTGKNVYVRVVRLKPYKEKIFKNHLIKNKVQI